MKNLFTSEQVTQGHPDRMADQLSDAVLEFCLKHDKQSKVACEVMVKDTTVVFGGEITSEVELSNKQLQRIADKVIKDIGYDWQPKIINLIGKQSHQINSGVVKEDGTFGAGDQGIIFGFACNETDSGHKLSFHICNEIIEQYDFVRTDIGKNILGPDAKTQITIDYTDEEPKIDTVVLSASLKTKEDDFESTQDWILKEVIIPVIYKYKITEDTKIMINPAGYWSYEFSGPIGDAGLTGRKIVCDQYGGGAPVGGGAFSGKDPTKVDRSAAYMARHVAKKIIKAYKNIGVEECLIQLSYAIGVAEPVSIKITTNMGNETNNHIAQKVKELYDFTPKGIIDYLGLLDDIKYTDCAKYGHMSKKDFVWEKTK